ncbi:MAG TPA: hypothetical protein VKM54_15585 [Myxococcota bacterium]|nr:hypothetical protein [Myxococcota bacterium]
MSEPGRHAGVIRIAMHGTDESTPASPLCRKPPPKTAADTSSERKPKHLAIDIVGAGLRALGAPGEQLDDALAPTMKPRTYHKAEENSEAPTGKYAHELGRAVVPCPHPQSHVMVSKV